MEKSERDTPQANDIRIIPITHSNDKNDPALHHEFDYSASFFDKDELSDFTVDDVKSNEKLGKNKEYEGERGKEEDGLDSSTSSSSSSTGSFAFKRIPSIFFSNKGRDKISEKYVKGGEKPKPIH